MSTEQARAGEVVPAFRKATPGIDSIVLKKVNDDPTGTLQQVQGAIGGHPRPRTGGACDRCP